LTDRKPGPWVASHRVRIQLGQVDLSPVLVLAHDIAYWSAPFPLRAQPHERRLAHDATAGGAVLIDSQRHQRTGVAVGPGQQDPAARASLLHPRVGDAVHRRGRDDPVVEGMRGIPEYPNHR
jgi:hypothetical protein